MRALVTGGGEALAVGSVPRRRNQEEEDGPQDHMATLCHQPPPPFLEESFSRVKLTL